MKVILALLLFHGSTVAGTDHNAYRETALGAAHWLKSSGVAIAAGKHWPPVPDDPGKPDHGLYSGSAGVVLFFAHLSQITGDKAWLDEAEKGGAYLLNVLSQEPLNMGAGLYTGSSGLGFVLEELYRISGKKSYREGAQTTVDHVKNILARPGGFKGEQVFSDIVSGMSGTGLFLLYAAKRFDPTAKDAARALGDRLIQAAIREGSPPNDQWRWRMRPDYQRLMPNFSHGTAGVVFFLARLYEDTGDPIYLNAALAGGRRLKSLINASGLIHHHEPDGKELFYLGWCHGPAGTSRAWFQLAKVTGDQQWTGLYRQSIDALVKLNPVKNRTPGFWNNVGQCCGSAGVADCVLGAHQQETNTVLLNLAQNITADIISRATVQDKGLKWTQAEHRVKPELLEAQTGYMQGAAGVGLWMLKMDAFKNGRPFSLRFPDEPF